MFDPLPCPPTKELTTSPDRLSRVTEKSFTPPRCTIRGTEGKYIVILSRLCRGVMVLIIPLVRLLTKTSEVTNMPVLVMLCPNVLQPPVLCSLLTKQLPILNVIREPPVPTDWTVEDRVSRHRGLNIIQIIPISCCLPRLLGVTRCIAGPMRANT